VQAWLADLSRDGHPPSQRNQALRVLSACLGEAVKQGKLPTNPCAGVRKAPQAPTSAQALTPDQVEAVRASMAPRDALVVSLMAYAGLRPEEVVALTWGDVGPVLVIDKAYTYGAPKTTKSGRRRTVEVVGPLAADLDAYRPAHAAPWHLVVQATRGGHLDWKNWTRRQWHDAATAAGVQAKPYDLRHTYCSLLINEGRSVLLVAAAMGHANSQLTLDTYSHLFDAAGPAHAVAMVDAVEAARAAAGTGLQTGCNARRRGHLRLVAAEG
jgi:integrase